MSVTYKPHMLDVVMLNVVMLSVVAPFQWQRFGEKLRMKATVTITGKFVFVD
jgi:hypothetical protein